MKKLDNTGTSRRRFVYQAGTLLGGALLARTLPTHALTVKAASAVTGKEEIVVGAWLNASNGLPVYQYSGPLPFVAVDKAGKDALLPEDPFFILGNYKCTLFAHASGIIQFLTGERAWARINAADTINYGANTATISLQAGDSHQQFDLIGMRSLASDVSVTKKYFGTGFGRFEYMLGNVLECKRILSVKPSMEIHTGSPSLVITIQLKNKGTEKLTVDYEEKMMMNYLPVNLQRKEKSKRLVNYPCRITADVKKQAAICSVTYSPTSFVIDQKSNESNFYDKFPESVFMQAITQANVDITCSAAASSEPALCVHFHLSLLAGETRSVSFVIGLTQTKDTGLINQQVNELLSGANFNHPSEGLFIQQWKKKLPDFSGETNEVFKREMAWNAYTLEAMATYSAYFNETYIPQGMLYTYQDGENISNRDHAQAMLPMCYTNPSLAKSSLRYVLKHSTYTGEIKRGSGGFGYIEPNVYQESDEQLYLFNSIAEYLRVTKDFGFLKETVQYYPAEYKQTVTVIDLLKKHFVYLRDVVSVGRNGLVRILNSDWSDSFFHKYSPNIYAGTAESILNTTMALAVLPKFISQLKNSGLTEPDTFIKALKKYHAQLLEAFLADFGNRDFAARCYLNGGKGEKLGMDHVCIEPQGYLLQIPELSVERKKAIYKKINAAIGLPETIGFRTREVPMWGGVGEGEDGGIWFSLEGAVLTGVITFDKASGWELLEKMSFHNYAKYFPGYWVGHWTFSDFVNSGLSPKEGLYSFWEPGLKNVFNGFCSHPHSWPLYCYLQLKE